MYLPGVSCLRHSGSLFTTLGPVLLSVISDASFGSRGSCRRCRRPQAGAQFTFGRGGREILRSARSGGPENLTSWTLFDGFVLLDLKGDSIHHVIITAHFNKGIQGRWRRPASSSTRPPTSFRPMSAITTSRPSRFRL